MTIARDYTPTLGRAAENRRFVVLPDFDAYHTFQISHINYRCAGCGWSRGHYIHDFRPEHSRVGKR